MTELKLQFKKNLTKILSSEGSGECPIVAEGKVIRIVGLTVEVIGTKMAIGAYCQIYLENGIRIMAEAVGFHEDRIYLMPIGDTHGIQPGARVVPIGHAAEVIINDDLIGRVINGEGQPLDGMPLFEKGTKRALIGQNINPLLRKPISQPLDVGIRAINSVLTIGRGQRIGLFAGSGVGKSVLLGMMTRYTEAEIIVVGLIGERGREVKEFIESSLGEKGRSRAIVVACPADDPPLLRVHGAWLATTIAEYFREQGKDVLLLMDSLTRFAQAQREISLAIGEPPATKGYTPSVFAKLPKLVERAGTSQSGKGSITAIYTVLTEGDDMMDPVADCARAILDGHIVLSRELADMGHYPAIDIESSVSRVMPSVVNKDHLSAAILLKKFYSIYRQNKDFISVGAYTPGHDHDLDLAIKLIPTIRKFLQQGVDETESIEQSLNRLQFVLKQINHTDSSSNLG